MEATKMVMSMVFGGLLWLLVHLYIVLIFKPNRVRSKLESQGIKGPSPSFFNGNVPEMQKISGQSKSTNIVTDEFSNGWVLKAIPHVLQWVKEYGRTFMYSNGKMMILCISDPDLVKELALQTNLDLGKSVFRSKDMRAVLGRRGIFTSNGSYWAHQRKIIAPELYLDKVKDMVTLIGNSAMTMVQSWEYMLKDAQYAEIKVGDHLRRLFADIIFRACFQSNETQGEMIFQKFKTLQELMFKPDLKLPGSRYVPTKRNREIWRLEKEINLLILDLVKTRTESKHKKDLLQSILEATKVRRDEGILKKYISDNRFIIDNFKNVFFAGNDTPTNTLSWCLMLLAANPEWQARARKEVLEICGEKIPDSDMLRSMKMLTMIIQETLRLYPPATNIVRETFQDIQLKHIHIPKGVTLHIVRLILNYDPNLWGPDVHKFNPERFAEGVKGACKRPQVYMPFGTGPRICPGQHFAMAEMKVVLSMILSRFSFSLSPKYIHSPITRLSLEPEHGVYLNIQRI